MTKQLTPEVFQKLKANATSGYLAKTNMFDFAYLEKQAEELASFQPPLTIEAWQAATAAAGRVYGIKSRGDRLQAVDRAYKTWISFGGAEGITHFGNAENLKSALETYIGVIYRMTGRVTGMSRDYRDERNKNGVLTNTLKLTTLISTMSAKSPANMDDRLRMRRRALVCLLGNVKIEWSPVGTLISGLGGAAMGANNLITNDLAKKITMACEAGVAGAAGGVGIYMMEEGGVKSAARSFINDQIESFKRWLNEVFTRQFGLASAAELMAKAGKALALVAKVAFKELASLAGGAADIFEGLKCLITDAWTRRALTLQQAHLVTSDGAFALIRNGIDIGIRNRQVVAAWTITKGTITTVMAATATQAAGKIADLVLGAFEFIFKLLYNLYEISCIGKFIAEARIMWTNVKNAPTPAVAVRAAPSEPMIGPQQAFVVPMVATGSMPGFQAAHYTPQQFINDERGAFLNFLDSLVKASPVLAAVVINAGAFEDGEGVFHAATPRSTDDAARARDHVIALKVEAEKLFRDSAYTVNPDTTIMNESDNMIYQALLNNAKLAKQPAAPIAVAAALP